jgi:transposase, IS5 family
MGPKSRHHAAEQDLFRLELVNLIDQRHELVKLAALIDWPAFEQAWGPKFESTTGRPVLPTRLMASLLYLKHTFALSDENVVKRWIENPYWKHFSGERCFRHELPCDPSSLVRWRQRIGEEGCEWLLEYSIKAAMSAGVVKRQSLDTMVVDTTMQPKAIAHPTDSRLLNRVREQLVAVSAQATHHASSRRISAVRPAANDAAATPRSVLPAVSVTGSARLWCSYTDPAR